MDSNKSVETGWSLGRKGWNVEPKWLAIGAVGVVGALALAGYVYFGKTVVQKAAPLPKKTSQVSKTQQEPIAAEETLGKPSIHQEKIGEGKNDTEEALSDHQTLIPESIENKDASESPSESTPMVDPPQDEMKEIVTDQEEADPASENENQNKPQAVAGDEDEDLNQASSAATTGSEHATESTALVEDGPMWTRALVGYASIQGHRSTMEDQFNISHPFEVDDEALDGISFFGVYDGHAGGNVSKILSEKLPEYVKSHKDLVSDREKALTESILRVEQDLIDTADALQEKVIEDPKTEPLFDESGSTVVCALLDGNQLVIANVGDSEAVLVKSRGTQLLSEIHAGGRNSKEAERMKKAGGRLAPNGYLLHSMFPGAKKIALSRSIGDLPFKNPGYGFPGVKAPPCALIATPFVRTVQLQPGDRALVLASDGLFDVMSHKEIRRLTLSALSNNINTLEIARILVTRASQLKSQDNITVIVVTFDWE